MILAGIDEAGYGPRLGPLVVALSVFRSAHPARLAHPAHPAGEGWPRMKVFKGKGPVAVGDSKAIYSGGDGLGALERTVFGFAASIAAPPARVSEYVARYIYDGGAEALSRDWYRWTDPELPREPQAGDISALGGEVRAALAANDLEYLQTAVSLVDEVRYNDMLVVEENKSTLLFGRNAKLMRRLWEEFGHEGIYLTCDRHGGRKFYAGLLDVAFPRAQINILLETEDESAYRLSDGDGREMRVRFKVRAEEADGATALSSMWAKYTREIFMRIFNDYWVARAGLRPTAGYWVDGERFLADLRAAAVVSDAVIDSITRWK